MRQDLISVWLSSGNNRFFITPSDPSYPELLKQIPAHPRYLFVEGNCELLSQPAIAMVGTRHPSNTGIHHATLFAKELAQAGLVIVSGLANGIDTASHQGALSHNGATIAVLGTGIDIIYPKQNRRLAQMILEKGGALVSEFPLGTLPMAYHFPKRNRVIAGLSMGTLVVEAALKSGSLITARFALELNRELFAIPGSIHNPVSKGCHELIRTGAKLVESARDIYAELGSFLGLSCAPLAAPKRASPTEKLAKDGELLVKCVDYEPTPLDLIVLRSGLSVSSVSVQLLELELLGLISQHPGGYTRNC